MELKQFFLPNTNANNPQTAQAREANAAYVAEALNGLFQGEPTVSPFVGGRTEGMIRLRVFNVGDYQAKRNDVGQAAGASQLSPYLRHGCLTLGEARNDAVQKIGGARAYKFIQELAWRQFWQLQRVRVGDRALTQDLENAKVPLGDNPMPDDVEAGDTGLVCMDTSVGSLHRTGYLFNHGRMWLAAYLVHHRKVAWQAGADFFYRYLLDGDPASNNLSWQWVASTFSHKPYFFNRENVQKYSKDENGDTYCTHCPAAANNTCPFDASYAVLGKRLFGANYDNDDNYASGTRGKNQRGSGTNRGNRDMAARRSSKRG